MTDKLFPPQWRITIRSNDGANIDNTEGPISGTYEEILSRAIVLARRTSYVPDAPNRMVYALIERWSYRAQRWVKIWDKRSKVSDKFHHANMARPLKVPTAGAPLIMS